MIDLNGALAELETEGKVRLYHATTAGFWTCGVFPGDHGGPAIHYGTAETPEDAIRVCLAVKANKAAWKRLGVVLSPFQTRRWGT